MRALLIVFITASFAIAQTKAQTKDCTAEGTVLNALTGHPVPHAQVVATPDQGASTDASGKWRIAGLPCTATRFTVNHAGFLEVTEGPGLIRLTPEAAIFGKVLDEAGDPIAGAEIQIFNSLIKQGRRVLSGSGSVNTNQAGEYRIALLQSGRYMVCARSTQVTYPVGGGSHIPYGEICNPAFPMDAGQEIREDFRLPAMPGVHVRGTVTGAPEGARIVVRMARASQIAHDNKFDFAGVVPGSYAIEGLAVLDGASRFAGATVNVGPSDADGVVLTFAPSVDVTGAVRFSGGKLPEDLKLYLSLVPSVALTNGAPGSFAGLPEWDATGSSFTWSAIPPGKYRVNADLPPGRNYIQSVSLEGRDIRGEELTIIAATGPIEIAIGDDGGTLEGSVTDADGKPALAQIMLLRGTLPPQIARGGSGGSLQPGGRFNPVGHIKKPGTSP